MDLCCVATKNCAQERIKAHVCQKKLFDLHVKKKLFDLPYCNFDLFIRSGENEVASPFPMVRIFYI